jgi:RNA polymerase sigma factor (sigma-70 family)
VRTEDGYIIQQCLDGDSAAFGFLVEKYKKPVYALAYSKLRNFHDAQDITQEVFLNAYQKLRTLRNWDNFMGWLYRITSNQCKMLLRARSRRPDREFVEDQEPGILDRPSVDSYHENMMYESIREALDSLPEMYREVMTLRYFGGMTVKEMARFLGVSPNTIDRRLSGARVQLKEEMLAMMSTAYEQHELPANLTFRIVEMVKRIKIRPMPRAAGLPWGLSLAMGIVITVMSLNPHLSINSDMAIPTGLPLLAEMKVLKTGEIPVEVLEVSQIPVLASMQGDGDDGAPELPQPALMAAHGEGGTWAAKADMSTKRFAPATCVLNGKIYAIGGWDRTQNLKTVEEYDPVTDIWTKKADMQVGGYGFSACALNGKIYGECSKMG